MIFIKKLNWFQLLTIVLTTELAGLMGGLLSGNTGQLYATLIKPPLSPPSWLFAIIWPLLYLLMGIAAYIMYQAPQTPLRQRSVLLYWIQLFVNFLWPIIFFRFNLYWLAVAVVIILDILVAITTVGFFKTKKTAGYLLLPYLIWILFATYLNIGVAILN